MMLFSEENVLRRLNMPTEVMSVFLGWIYFSKSVELQGSLVSYMTELRKEVVEDLKRLLRGVWRSRLCLSDLNWVLYWS